MESSRALAVASNLLGCNEYAQHEALEAYGAGSNLKYNCLSQACVNYCTDYTIVSDNIFIISDTVICVTMKLMWSNQ